MRNLPQIQALAGQHVRAMPAAPRPWPDPPPIGTGGATLCRSELYRPARPPLGTECTGGGTTSAAEFPNCSLSDVGCAGDLNGRRNDLVLHLPSRIPARRIEVTVDFARRGSHNGRRQRELGMQVGNRARVPKPRAALQLRLASREDEPMSVALRSYGGWVALVGFDAFRPHPVRLEFRAAERWSGSSA